MVHAETITIKISATHPTFDLIKDDNDFSLAVERFIDEYTEIRSDLNLGAQLQSHQGFQSQLDGFHSLIGSTAGK